MTAARVPMDLRAYEQRVRSGRCFICALAAAEPGSEHEVVYDNGEHMAFLGRYPTVLGHTLVAPRSHVEHVVRGIDLESHLRLQTVVYRVARAVEAVVPSERTYLLTLGSQPGNSHLHWHIAPLPPGTPYEQQQFHALMAENGIIPWTAEQAAEMAVKIRTVLAQQAAG